MSARAEQLKQAIVTAADVKVDLTNDCIIKNWLGESAISVVYGDSNCGKSFFAVDLAYHVAAGQNWFGQKVRAGNVLYVAAEGGRGFGKRIAAIRARKVGLDAAGKQNLSLLPLQIDLHGAADSSAIINQAEPSQYSLVVVDTLAMSMGDGSENEGRDMGMFLSNIMRLKAYFNCHILIVHHTGKDRSKGARGHSSLRAALDTEIELKADLLVRVALVTKQRDMESGRKVAFTLEVVELGRDDDLDAVTSCVVSSADIPDSIIHPAAKLLTPACGMMILSCDGLKMTQNLTQFAKVSTGRETGCRQMIIFANMRIKSGLLMTRTDRTNSGHVCYVRRHF